MSSYMHLSSVLLLSSLLSLMGNGEALEETGKSENVLKSLNEPHIRNLAVIYGNKQEASRFSRDTDSDISQPNSLEREEQCILCPPGIPGPPGPPGQQGIQGRDGRDGRDHCGGSSNEDNAKNEIIGHNSTGGAVFVRWGRNECPSSSDLVYSGITAGGHYTHAGSGSNYLCMPEDPIYDEPQAGTSGQDRALVYGAEYEMNTFTKWNHLHDSNVPCAVCWAHSRPSLLMVPARNVCPGSDWTIEYSGYLVAEYHGHKRTEFVCMDRAPVAVSRSSHNANGVLFYVAESRCGSGGSGLPCGPYVNGYELTCAVCTR